jgi:hypothetical protein
MIQNWEEVDRFLVQRGVRIGAADLAQTTGGTHARSSNHYVGAARDYGAQESDASAVARQLEFIALQPGGPIAELFCAVGGVSIFIKDGRRLSPVSPSLRALHRNHCHVALKPGRRLF